MFPHAANYAAHVPHRSKTRRSTRGRAVVRESGCVGSQGECGARLGTGGMRHEHTIPPLAATYAPCACEAAQPHAAFGLQGRMHRVVPRGATGAGAPGARGCESGRGRARVAGGTIASCVVARETGSRSGAVPRALAASGPRRTPAPRTGPGAIGCRLFGVGAFWFGCSQWLQ